MKVSSFLIEPNINVTKYGYVLATTPSSVPVRIGVIGIDEDDARRKFSDSLKRWKQIEDESLLEQKE
jgi:hypothetical protein